MSNNKEKQKKNPGIEVPETETDIKVIDMRLGELVLGIVACLTLTALGYTYYTFIKSKAESRKMESMATIVSEAIKGVADVMEKNIARTPKATIVRISKPRLRNKSRGVQA